MDWNVIAQAVHDFGVQMGPFNWLLKIVGLAAFILLMVMVVALLYSGEVQNSEKGPISFVGKSSVDDETFHAPDPIITNSLDGKRALCTIFISYVDRRGRPRRRQILRKRFSFKKLSRSAPRDLNAAVGFWNPTRHDAVVSAIQDAGVPPDPPNLFSTGTSPTETPHPISEYFSREVSETKTIVVSNKVLQAISLAHCQFLTEEFGKLQRVARDERGRRHLENKREYLDLPNLNEDAHYFVEMKFSINPLFVLSEHPDGQVKTTAWLTVLTSVFAMIMQFIYNGMG